MNNNYAGFWLRFVAYIIDYIIIWVAQSFIFVPILGILGLSFASGMEAGGADVDSAAAVGMLAGIFAAMAATALLSAIIALLYWTLMESSKFQGTVGKIALGIKVTDMEGNKLDFVKALVRNLCKIISGLILFLGYIMAGFTDKKQGLHDMIANTLVVKK
jgi:uncharacterized RDD family membrane protein YckC